MSRAGLETILAGRRGFVPLAYSQLLTLLDPVGPNAWIERDKEPGGLEDPDGVGRSWVQVIPYGVIVNNDPAWWVYRRNGGGEARLEGQLSIGVGGHVEECDRRPGGPIISAYAALARELAEEVTWEPMPGSTGPEYRGVLFLDGPDVPPVNHVHLGLVFTIPMANVEARPGEGIDPIGWRTAPGLIAGRVDFELWSRTLIEGGLIDRGAAR